MEHVREIAKSIITDMQRAVNDCNPRESENYRRMAIIDYSKAIRECPFRSPEINERALEAARIMAEKAISLGVTEESMNESLYKVRQCWIPRLKEASQ